MTGTPSPELPQTETTQQRRPDRRAALIGSAAGASGAVLAVALIAYFALRA